MIINKKVVASVEGIDILRVIKREQIVYSATYSLSTWDRAKEFDNDSWFLIEPSPVKFYDIENIKVAFHCKEK